MVKTWLKSILNSIKNLKDWIWEQIRKIWNTLTHLPQRIFILINTVLLIFALWLTIQNAREASRFQENVVTNLRRITELSDSLRNSLDALPKSIESFDASIGSLNENVNSFSSSLVSYKDQLNQIINATDKQIALLKETQKRWEEEISRKPDLFLRADSSALISIDTLFVQFDLYNKGNKVGKVSAIILLIPTNLEFIAKNWLLVEQDSLWKFYSLSKSFEVPYDPSTYKTGVTGSTYFRFQLIKSTHYKFPTMIKYLIFEEKIGSQEGELKLNITR